MSFCDFAQTDDEAHARYVHYSRFDPYPNIAPALLNSADIYDYVRQTGMIHPFDRGEGCLKSALYEIPFLGQVIWWENGKRIERDISNGTRFTLKENAIVFVWLGTIFRLPDYIAMRFNFRIRHVHRGLLLGTGPMVDPGFWGKLLIPVHNLTSADYELIGGDGLIWAEFTKVSSNRRWHPDSERSELNFRAFPRSETHQEPHYYFERAFSNQPIESSIPPAINAAREKSEQALESAKRTKEELDSAKRTIRWGTIIGLVLATVFGIPPILSVVQDAVIAVTNGSRQIEEVSRKLDTFKHVELENRVRIEALEKKLQSEQKPQGTESTFKGKAGKQSNVK